MEPTELQALQDKYEVLRGLLSQYVIYPVEDHVYGCKLCGACSPEGEHLYHAPTCVLV